MQESGGGNFQSSRRSDRHRIALLIGGGLTGLIIAGIGLVTQWPVAADSLPPGAVARVGDRVIAESELERVALDLAADKRTAADGDRQFSLQRIIEEELLVQRGVELGFPETAPNIRKALAAAVIKQVIAEAQAVAPSRKELRAFYDADSTFFAQSERWRVRWLKADKDNPPPQSRQAVGELLSAPCGATDAIQSGDLEVVYELPNSLLPLAKLMDYMGPALARQATRMQPGECSAPVLVDDAYHMLYLEEYQPGQVPDFDSIVGVIESEYTRRAGEKALLDYLQWLRERTEIVIDESGLN